MKITVNEVARLLAVSEETVFNWVRKGSIPVTRVQEQYRFNRAEILEWATARGMPVSVELFPAPDDGESGLVRLSDALERGGVVYDAPGGDKEQVLHALIEAMNLPDGVDRELMFDFFLAREALGSTGVGDGIAIPHVRTPVVLHVQRPFITLCFLANAVDFAAIDGRPVTTLFSLIAPSTRSHLQLLSRLSLALHDPGFRAVITRRAARDEILEEARRVERSFREPERSQKR